MEADNQIAEFCCLNPRKIKHILIAAVLEPLGSIIWRRCPPLAFRSYPETRVRAEVALAAGSRPTKNRFACKLKRKILELQYNGSRAYFEAKPGLMAVVWNGLNGSRRVFSDAAEDAGARRLFFELAPLPGRITVDPTGVNFRNCLPRSIEFYQHWFANAGVAPDAWREAGRAICQRPANLRVQEKTDACVPPMSEPFLFVPLQVPGDSQLRLFGGAFKTVPAFIDALVEAASALPKGWHLRVKEHPSSPKSFCKMFDSLNGVPIFLDNEADTFESVAASRGVITVNSSVGLEAMFYDKPVVAAGQCFWAIEGVAQSVSTVADLVRICASPNELSFNQSHRNAFMSFLTQVYYIALDKNSDGAAFLRSDEIKKVVARLDGLDMFNCFNKSFAI